MDRSDLCAICGKRRASVFVTQVDQNGNPTTKNICLACANKMGLPQINDIMRKMGISPEDLEQLNDDLDAMLESAENGEGSLTEQLSEQLRELGTDGMMNELAAAAEEMSGDIGDAFGEENSSQDDERKSADEKNDGEDSPSNDVPSEDKERDTDSRKSATNTPDFFSFLRNMGMMFGPPGQPRPFNPNAPQGANPQNAAQGGNSGNAGVNSSKQNGSKDKGKKPMQLKFLSQYGINLNEKAEKGLIDNVIGREREIERVIQILNRRTKNNPALVGEPGVGKTAIAEGLALRIQKKEVPFKLQDKIVILLDLTAMVAGTQFRGQFEGRMKGVIDEVKRAGNIILVIDEVHNIMGAGEAEGSLNAANILKPALSRGEIQVIGATTLKEYRKYIEKDGALERRFQPVMVEEPTIQETIEILKGIRGHYEDYHFVRFNDEIIEAAVRLSERYITDRFLPDKAIDVIDEAASRANLRNNVLAKIEEIKAAVAAEQAALSKIEAEGSSESSKAENNGSEVSPDDNGAEDEASREEKARIEHFKKIADQKSAIAKLEQELSALEASKYVDIIYDDIAKVIEVWTGIPVKVISEEEAKKLLKLDNRLKERVIGQDKAVDAVSKAIRRNRSGFRKRFKPSSFIFAGPTGVGKTELVKQLTIELFGNTDSLIRLDMSEYMEKHTVSKLIGSPPGYVGYDEAGQLTEKVRRHPYSVILFDEIEKAHPDVFNMLLQILDNGRLTDSQGRVVNFENTVIILTTNAYGKTGKGTLGFGGEDASLEATEAEAMAALKKVFRPEFLNRIDEIVVFEPLKKESLIKITGLMLREVIEACVARGVRLDITDNAIELITDKGYDAEYGARPLRRYIQRHIEDELAELSLTGVLENCSAVTVDEENGEIVIKTGGLL